MTGNKKQNIKDKRFKKYGKTIPSFDEEKANQILEILESGPERRVMACKACKIGYDTFMTWMETKAEFAEGVKTAEQKGIAITRERALKKVTDFETWQQGAWWLERTDPDHFAQKIKNDVNNAGELKIRITYGKDSGLGSAKVSPETGSDSGEPDEV